MRRGKPGKAIRATARNREAGVMTGVSTNFAAAVVVAASFMGGSGIIIGPMIGSLHGRGSSDILHAMLPAIITIFTPRGIMHVAAMAPDGSKGVIQRAIRPGAASGREAFGPRPDGLFMRNGG